LHLGESENCLEQWSPNEPAGTINKTVQVQPVPWSVVLEGSAMPEAKICLGLLLKPKSEQTRHKLEAMLKDNPPILKSQEAFGAC